MSDEPLRNSRLFCSTLQFGLAADVLNNFHGNVTLYMGYRLKDGTLIYNGTEPVKLTLPH